MTSSGSLPRHNLLQRDRQRPFLPSFGLWGHLSRTTQPNLPSSSNARSTTPSIVPLDKAGASTRILLHDTQAHLEKFAERVTQLTTEVADAKRELVAIQKLYQEDHEQLLERMIGLANRCQTELQKTIGAPSQSSEVRNTLRVAEALGSRLEVLDKKVDLLSMAGQTQSQALQTIQDQQGQILTALLPILPLLQAVPLHIEMSSKNVEDAVSESKSDVKARITDLGGRVKSSFEELGNQIRGSLSQDHVKNGASALRSHVQDSVSDLRPISTPVTAASPTDRLARGTSRSRSRSQKRPRSGSPTGFSDPATCPSDSKKRRLDNQSGRAAHFPAHSSHLVSGTASRRIHTPTVPTTTPSSSSHASPDILPSAAYMRSADQLVRTPLADLDPRTPDAPLNPASIVSSAPKNLRGSRSTLHAHPTMPAGPPIRAFSTQSYSAQAQTLALAAPSGYTMPTSSPTCAAPITPGSFRLPLPALRLSRTATATPRSHTTLNGSTSSSRHPAVGEKPRISGAPIHAQASRTRTLTLGLPGFREGAVQDAYHGTPVGSAHAFGVGLPLGVGVGGGTPRTPRLPVDASAGTSTSTSTGVAPPPPSSVGKPMSLKDRRAMLAEDRLRDEGKRFIPLDDEEDEDVETAG